MPFHPRHHRALLALAGALLLLAAYRRLTHPVLLPPPGQDGDLANALSLKLDPNTATEPELEALPGIGPGRAQNILDYRESHKQDAPAFRSPEDLRKVKNLPQSVIDEISPHLTFPPP